MQETFKERRYPRHTGYETETFFPQHYKEIGMNKITNALHGFRTQNAKLIEGDDGIRAQKCMQEINVLLEQYDCLLIPEFHIVGTQIATAVKIVPKPRQQKGQDHAKRGSLQ